jgi:hypothetical protein
MLFLDIFLIVVQSTCVTGVLQFYASLSVMLFCRKDILQILLHIVIQASSAKGFPSSYTRLKSLRSTVIFEAVNYLCMKI